MLRCILAFSWHLIGRAVSEHLRTNRWLDGTEMWWDNSLQASSDLINFWSCSTEFLLLPGLWLVNLWLVEPFPCICRQTADQIGLKFGGPTRYGPPPTWLPFGLPPLNSYNFVSSDWANRFHAFANIDVKFGGPTCGTCIHWCLVEIGELYGPKACWSYV